MKSGLEEALLSSLPKDITAEEIAAIRAAAAAFSAPGNESSFKPARDQAEAPPLEPIGQAEGHFSESAASKTPSAVAQTESAAPKEGATTAEPGSAVDVPAETVPSPAMIVSESNSSPLAEFVNAESGKLAVDEVTAALASLAPANDHGDSAVTDQEADKWNAAAREQVPVTMAVAGATQEFSGPRWIAESVAVMDEEASLLLEQEMEKAYAAFAAADAARTNFGSSPGSDAPSTVADYSPATSEATSSPVESFSNLDRSEPISQDPTAHTSAGPSAESEAALTVEAAPPTVDAISESAVPETKENAAYAAAASASPSAPEPTMASEITPPAPVMESSENPPAPESSGRQGESELAAAWANWKQIRESVIGSQLSGSQLNSQIADTIAELKESGELRSELHAEASSATGEESSEIANIVDSVLADLKPKLMAEIAKKMGKEKKK